MTRRRLWEPPAHLASAFHTHVCPKCSVEYGCYNVTHEEGTSRLCGSTGCKS